MSRLPRPDFSGMVVHVLNRAVDRKTLFHSNDDYATFERVLREAIKRSKVRILAFCVMPNHWHLLVWPRSTPELSRFVKWLTQTHSARWHLSNDTVGTGAVYQGRYKAFPLESDGHISIVAGYVERNALSAGLVSRAEDWMWGSHYHRVHGDPYNFLAAPPVPFRADWSRFVNTLQGEAEKKRLRRCTERGTPFGSPAWVEKVTTKLGLSSTIRPRGGQAKGVWPVT